LPRHLQPARGTAAGRDGMDATFRRSQTREIVEAYQPGNLLWELTSVLLVSISQHPFFKFTWPMLLATLSFGGSSDVRRSRLSSATYSRLSLPSKHAQALIFWARLRLAISPREPCERLKGGSLCAERRWRRNGRHEDTRVLTWRMYFRAATNLVNTFHYRTGFRGCVTSRQTLISGYSKRWTGETGRLPAPTEQTPTSTEGECRGIPLACRERRQV